MYPYGPLHMDKQRQGDLPEPSYCSSVSIQRTNWKQWTIGRSGERRSGLSVLMAWQEDDEFIFKVKILDKSVDVSSILLQPSYGQVVGQTNFFSLFEQPERKKTLNSNHLNLCNRNCLIKYILLEFFNLFEFRIILLLQYLPFQG